MGRNHTLKKNIWRKNPPKTSEHTKICGIFKALHSGMINNYIIVVNIFLILGANSIRQLVRHSDSASKVT